MRNLFRKRYYVLMVGHDAWIECVRLWRPYMAKHLKNAGPFYSKDVAQYWLTYHNWKFNNARK